MSLAPELRLRAQQLYLADWPAGRIAGELDVSRATVNRWVDTYGWRELREMQQRLEREAGELVLKLTQEARRSGDPQQAYAALHAAELAGMRAPIETGPRPAEIAEALLSAIAADPELGPLVRKRRDFVVAAVTAELERISGRKDAR